MLSNFRAFAKSPAAIVLIGLLIVAFGVFGITDVFRGKAAGNYVITAGDRTVTSAEFKREFDSYKARLEQQVGQPISMEAVAANGLDRRALGGMATREAFGAYLTKIGLHPSDKLIASEIAKIPAFFDQVTGKFDKKSYAQKLGENGLTPARFESGIGDELAQQQFGAGLAAGLRVPRAYTALAAIFGLETRDIGYFTIEPTSVPQPPPPTDDQLRGFMKEHAAQLTRPEMRQLTVVRFSPALVSANLPVDPAELKKRYDFRKDTLSTPETRTIIQISARDQAAAQAIGQRLAKGDDPSAVAKAVGVDAITYAGKPQSAIADRKLAKAAFAMQAGQVAPVQGDLGVAIVKVVSVTPGRPVTLEEVRPALEAEIRKDAAAEKVYALTQTYDDAHQAGSNLVQAAAKAGVPTTSLGAVSAQGLDGQGQPVPGLTQKMAETAFALPAGGESEIQDAGGGEYFAVRVEKIIPPALAGLEEVRPQITRAFVMQEVARHMQARADAFVARLRKGESLEAVAASAGSRVVQIPAISRQVAAQDKAMPQQLLAKAFNAKPGEVFNADNGQFGLVVGKLEAVRSGEGAIEAQMAEAMRPQMSMAIFREIGESAHAAARAKIKVTADAARARAALGLEPEAAPADPKGKAKPAAKKPEPAK